MKNILFIAVLCFIGCFNEEPRKKFKVLRIVDKNDTTTYYKDFDFSTFKGIKKVEKYEIPAFIEVLSKNNDSISLKIYQREIVPEIIKKYDDYGKCINCPNRYYEYIEVFENKGDYYYQFDEYLEKIPGSIVQTHKYFNLKRNEILIIDVYIENELDDSYSITKILLKEKQKETIDFSGKCNKEFLNPNLDWDKLKKHPNAYSWDIYKYEKQKRGLAVRYVFNDLRSNSIDTGCNLYKGYPTKDVNIYWNLYEGYFSINVDDKFDNCD